MLAASKTKSVCRATRKPKCQQHLVFPGGHPSKYWPHPTLLNFADRTRSGVFNVVWPLTRQTCIFWLFHPNVDVNVNPKGKQNNQQPNKHTRVCHDIHSWKYIGKAMCIFQTFHKQPKATAKSSAEMKSTTTTSLMHINNNKLYAPNIACTLALQFTANDY